MFNTRILGRELTRLLVVLAFLAFTCIGPGLFTVGPAQAATSTANITIYVTPGVVGGSCNASTWSPGVVAVSTTSNTSIAYFGVTNTSTVAANWTLSTTNATWQPGSNPWTHSDTATADVDQIGVKADRTDPWGGDDAAVPQATSLVIYGNCAALTDFDFGLSLVMPTSSTDNDQKANSIELSVVAY